jgi:hypothetical protein
MCLWKIPQVGLLGKVKMKYVCLEKTDIGATLTTWIYCAMWQLWSAEKMGLDGYINWPDGFSPPRALRPYHDPEMFKAVPNMFDWYFVQPKVATLPPRDLVWTWETNPETGQYPLMSQPLSVIKAYYKQHLHFAPRVDAAANVLVQKYGIDFDKTIGITWRGTDNITDGRPRLPIAVYYPFIDDILQETPDMRIMCTAEENTVLAPLLAKYPQAFRVEEFYSSPLGSPHNPERFSPFSGYQRGLQPALMVWLFSKCKHYIKNRSSTGAVASWLSSGRIVSLAHPETLGYENHLDKAEINGELYPLYR